MPFGEFMDLIYTLRVYFASIAHTKNTATLSMQVVMFHVFPHLLRKDGAGEGKPTVDLEGFFPLSRLGGNTFARLGSVFDIPRPRVTKWT